MRGFAVLAALVVLTAGCVGTGEDTEPTQAQSVEETSQAENRTLYLDGDLGLTEREPSGEAETVPAGNFYTTWTRGEEQPPWTGEPPEDPLVVHNATLEFYYSSESVTATTGPQDQGFPEFVVYFGTEASPAAWASVEGPDVVTSDDVIEVTAELNLPSGGLYLSENAEPVVKLAPVQGQGSVENTRLEFLVNGQATPSRVTFEATPVDTIDAKRENVVDEVGTLAGSAYALGDQEDTTADTYDVEVTEATSGLDARLERLDGVGIADIDLHVLGPEGDVVAQSVTPEDDEGLTLRGANVDAIGTGTWTVRAINYGNAAVSYELTVDRLMAPGQG